MSNAGRVIQHEGRELGQSIIFLEGFLKTPIVSWDVPPSWQPCGGIGPPGHFPSCSLPSSGVQMLGQLLGVQEHPSRCRVLREHSGKGSANLCQAETMETVSF